MKRKSIFNHRKFLRLSYSIGSKALAIGHLQLLWHSARVAQNPAIGSAVDVEAAAHWQGEPGRLTAALLDAGGVGRAGFIEACDDATTYVLHDYLQNTSRSARRRSSGGLSVKLREGASEARKKAARARWGPGVDCLPVDREGRLAAARLKGSHGKQEWLEMRSVYGRCLRCSESGPLVKDHVIPLFLGGTDSITNIQPLCVFCNGSKGRETIDYRLGLEETRPSWIPAANDNPLRASLPQADTL